jgi:metal-responsive CopG/Arc/MetJ family transcriptional regulator
VAVDEKIAREVDELVAECDDLGVSCSEIVKAMLTAYIQSDTDHVEQVREFIIRRLKGNLNAFFAP